MTAVDVLCERRDAASCERVIRIPSNLGCVEGHFPDAPVVPGFVQLGWAIDAARTLVGGDAAPSRIESLKFKEIVRPGETLVVRAERRGGLIHFLLQRGAVVVSAGRLVFP